MSGGAFLRYMAFGGDSFYPAANLGDFLGSFADYDAAAALVAARPPADAEDWAPDYTHDWGCVLDLKTGNLRRWRGVYRGIMSWSDEWEPLKPQVGPWWQGD